MGWRYDVTEYGPTDSVSRSRRWRACRTATTRSTARGRGRVDGLGLVPDPMRERRLHDRMRRMGPLGPMVARAPPDARSAAVEDGTSRAPRPHRVAQSRPKSRAEASTQSRTRTGRSSDKCIIIMQLFSACRRRGGGVARGPGPEAEDDAPRERGVGHPRPAPAREAAVSRYRNELAGQREAIRARWG